MVKLIIERNDEQKLSLGVDASQELSSYHEEVIILLWIHSNHSPSTPMATEIESHLLPSSNEALCILDISQFVHSTDSDSLWLLLNLFSLSSGLLLEKTQDDSIFLQLHFLEQFLSLFHNEMGALKSTIPFPSLLFYSSSPLSVKDAKKVLENFVKPESGFSEDISQRNVLKGILDSLFHSKEFLSPDAGVPNKLELFSSPNFTKRFSSFHSMPFGCLRLTGSLLTMILRSFLEDGLGYQRFSPEIRDQLIEDYLSSFENLSYDLFVTHLKSSAAASASLVNEPTPASLPLLQSLKQEAIQNHSKSIAVWNHHSIASRKKLQSKIELDLEEFRERIREHVSQNCQQLLIDLNKISTNTATAPDTNTATAVGGHTALALGESANSYNEFLALKNAIEKLVTSYSTSTQRYVTSSAANSTSGSGNDRLFSEELNTLRAEILRTYLIQRLKTSLEMGGQWLNSFSDLVSSTSQKKDSLRSQLQSLQTRNAELNTSIDQKKRVTAENYRLLTTSLSELRSKKTLELEARHSEIESLVEAIDRSTRLNEREKAEIADELMEIQQRIQVAQGKALELRQQREEQTNLLHNNLLESEREGHRWFRTAFANQHTLLADELSLERQLNQRKSEQLAELFALEGEHLRHLDNMRTVGQKETQKLREEHFQQRDTLSKEHDTTLTYLRMRNIELEGKLSANQNPSGNKSEHEGCQVM